MVSKASEDLPDPETPVTTVRVLCGISKSTFFRLWTRAPRTTMLSFDIRRKPIPDALREVHEAEGNSQLYLLEPGALERSSARFLPRQGPLLQISRLL